MKIDVDAQELSTLLDGISALPLARGYNLFNKLMQQGVAEGVIKQQPPADLVKVPPVGEDADPAAQLKTVPMQ